MGKLFRFVRYKTRSDERGRIDFDDLRRVALETEPKIVLCGYTSYPRDYDYRDFKRVADQVGALTMADVAQIGGLIAAGAMRNPFDAGFDVVTTTTHKTLRGPRAGLILCRKPFAKQIDRSVFPGLDRVQVTVNKQIVPDDPNPPLRPSGIRLGAPAATTRGMKQAERTQLAEWICAAIRRRDDPTALQSLATEVQSFCARFPVPGLGPLSPGEEGQVQIG